jgi:ATP-dependent 26S proteasome regulatory subunit
MKQMFHFIVAGSEFVEMFIGIGARIRDLFKSFRKYLVLFLLMRLMLLRDVVLDWK